MMSKSTALLISRDPFVVEAVRGACNSIPHLQLEPCDSPEPACRLVGRPDVALVLAHLPAAGGDEGVTRLLRAVVTVRRPCSTLVLANRRHDPQASALLRAGAADFLEVPAELPGSPTSPTPSRAASPPPPRRRPKRKSRTTGWRA
jgi:hypothetical protein